MADRWRATAAVAALLFVPWTAIPADGGLSLVFLWGLAGVDPLTVTPLPEYLARVGVLPPRLRSWPVSLVLYASALASVVAGATVSREDRRVTGGLLVLAGASHLLVAVGLVRRGVPALPVGPVLAWAVAWWHYGPDLAAAVTGRRR